MLLTLLLALLAGTGVLAWTCSSVQIYVDSKANATVGIINNGSSPSTAYATVQDAAVMVASVINASTSDTVYAQPIVNIAPGTYYMSEYLFLTPYHSGSAECPTIFQNGGIGEVVLSGGVPISNWSQVSNMSGVWSAPVPSGSQTRALYVDGISAPRARSQSIPQNESIFTPEGYQFNMSQYSVSSIIDPQRAELRFIGTFTDRYMPIGFVASDGKTLMMKQPAWYRNLIGYDTISQKLGPGTYFGTAGLYLGEQDFFIENSISFLDSPGEWFLDVESDTLYYMPVDGKNPEQSSVILPVLEVLLSVGGFNYQDPVHDIDFVDISFAHTTWNFPTSKYGYPDQQTGAYIGEQWNRTSFEGARNFWFTVPGAVQVSVAERINFQGGAISCTGAAGMGVGNDANAHLSGFGLGAKNVTVQSMTFTQTGSNAYQAGGINADGHHPALAEAINSGLVITNCSFYENARIYTSATNLLVTYVQFSTITHNTISNTTYSSLSQGWGWGSNDPKGPTGSPSYFQRGLYNFQPIYQTPTTLHDNYIGQNVLFNIGVNHTDEGAIYCLSASPGTIIESNFIDNSSAQGVYLDEGSRDYTVQNNVIYARGNWFYENNQTNDIADTGNNIFQNNYVSKDNNLNIPNTSYGSQFINNIFFNASLPFPQGYPQPAQDIANAAGVQ